MKNIKLIKKEELKDWAKEIFKKNSFIWLMSRRRKKLLDVH